MLRTILVIQCIARTLALVDFILPCADGNVGAAQLFRQLSFCQIGQAKLVCVLLFELLLWFLPANRCQLLIDGFVLQIHVAVADQLFQFLLTGGQLFDLAVKG